jgi:hypothetical protein
MAKRKRLSPASPGLFTAPEPAAAPSRAPIADVARETASASALEALSQEMRAARETGRMVLTLPLSEIVLDHLVRDRITAETEEMEALIASLAARGQQTPVEVMALPGGRYGLISGWRRCQALARLSDDGSHDGTVLALLRKPSDASDAYLSMVEENEIRVGLSYFERARIAAKAVEQGVFETEKAALLELFRTASRPKRSKIRSFLPLVAAFDGVLAFPHMIGERLGLRLAAALADDPGLAETITARLRAEAPETAEGELALLTAVLEAAGPRPDRGDEAPPKQTAPRPDRTEKQVHPGLRVSWEEGGDRLVLQGPAMTPEVRAALLKWLETTL